MDQVLFICTGNYYRSRYAELLFNYTAKQYQIGWASFSRGFQESTREAPISPHAISRLYEKNIFPGQIRFPIKLSTSDLALAQRVILLDETEHRPMMESQFAEWSDCVEYWNIKDVEFESPVSALDKLERQVDMLIGRLESENSQLIWEESQLRARFY